MMKILLEYKQKALHFFSADTKYWPIGMFYDKVSSVLYSLFFDRTKVLPKLWQYKFLTLT
jgi:hypothetical protein